MADFADGAVAIVGGDFHDDSDAARAVALEGDFFVIDAFELAGAAFNGAVNRIIRHIHTLSISYDLTQAGVLIDIAASPGTRGYRNFFDQFRENFSAFGI